MADGNFYFECGEVFISTTHDFFWYWRPQIHGHHLMPWPSVLSTQWVQHIYNLIHLIDRVVEFRAGKVLHNMIILKRFSNTTSADLRLLKVSLQLLLRWPHCTEHSVVALPFSAIILRLLLNGMLSIPKNGCCFNIISACTQEWRRRRRRLLLVHWHDTMQCSRLRWVREAEMSETKSTDLIFTYGGYM